MGLELARKALNNLHADPAGYDPATFITERTTDLAGRICLDAGAQPVWGETWGGATAHVEYGGKVWGVLPLARHLTGTTHGEIVALSAPRVTLPIMESLVSTLEADRMLTNGIGYPLILAEEMWTTRDGQAMIWRHRRTVAYRDTDGIHALNPMTREQAHDAACALPRASTLHYHHYRHIWEPRT